MALMRANQPEAAVHRIPDLLCTPYLHVYTCTYTVDVRGFLETFQGRGRKSGLPKIEGELALYQDCPVLN